MIGWSAVIIHLRQNLDNPDPMKSNRLNRYKQKLKGERSAAQSKITEDVCETCNVRQGIPLNCCFHSDQLVMDRCDGHSFTLRDHHVLNL